MKYDVKNVFGCNEQVPKNCPTFFEREVHKQFKNALISKNIIVVYGESKQGKTWTIEKYCPNQCRIGCTNDMELLRLKVSILEKLGLPFETGHYERVTTFEKEREGGISTSFKAVSLKHGRKKSNSTRETLTGDYQTINIDDNNAYINAIKQIIRERWIVLDNFHYLDPEIQRQFCSMLKEFNYHNIKIIILGVWKESSRISALAPDLGNRCVHIDIGTWSNQELEQVCNQGEKALNIKFSEEIIQYSVGKCANNIGIFKDFLEQLCLSWDIHQTQKTIKTLNNLSSAQGIIQKYVTNEFINPLRDRLRNLAIPSRVRKEAKHVRERIVLALLQLLIDKDVSVIRNGILLSDVLAQIEREYCYSSILKLSRSNIVQELGVLHKRGETRGAIGNFIPLFYFDKSNNKVFILEPNLFVIKSIFPQEISGFIDYIKG